MNPSWLFWHIIEAIRSPSRRPPVRDVYCPLWLAEFLGAAGLGFLYCLIVEALL